MNREIKHYVKTKRKSAGLGNEIFNYSKAWIANEMYQGRLISPSYSNGLHDIPSQLKKNTSRWRVFLIIRALLTRKCKVIDQILYFSTAKEIGSWDYGDVFKFIAEQNPRKTFFIHSSGMSGGYLSISRSRSHLRELFGIQTSHDVNVFNISIHVRGPVEFKKRFWSFERAPDFRSDSDDLKYGKFNSRTPIFFYIEAIERLVTLNDLKDIKIQLVTNMEIDSKDIKDIVDFMAKRHLDYKIVRSGVVNSLKTLAEGKLIIPSVSSFSFLSIFLSDGRYIWPDYCLFEQNGFLSVWGYESGQLVDGPTGRSIMELEGKGPTSIYLCRGVPIRYLDKLDYSCWIDKNASEFPKCADLIYYGVVPAIK